MDIGMDVFIFPVMAFLAVVVLIPLAIKFAPVLKLIDAPDERKCHEGDVPLIGGLVIFPVFIVLAVLAGFSPVVYWPLYLGIMLLLVTGAVDDRVHVRPVVKFAVQCFVAWLVVVPGGAQVFQLGDLFGFGKMGLEFMSLPFSLAAVVLLINAVNLMDGLDGLAAGSVCVALGWFAVAFLMAGQVDQVLMIGVLIAAVVGFLVYNLRTPCRAKACVFLGDAGSLCLGLCVAWYAIYVTKEPSSAAVPMSVAWVLAVPIFDICAQFYRRTREGRHPFSPDRGHFHHHFGVAGIADGYAVVMILGLGFVFGAVGIGLVTFGVPQVVLTAFWILGILSHMYVSVNPERYVRVLRRFAGD